VFMSDYVIINAYGLKWLVLYIPRYPLSRPSREHVYFTRQVDSILHQRCNDVLYLKEHRWCVITFTKTKFTDNLHQWVYIMNIIDASEQSTKFTRCPQTSFAQSCYCSVLPKLYGSSSQDGSRFSGRLFQRFWLAQLFAASILFWFCRFISAQFWL
jgi:hypothetical protein